MSPDDRRRLPWWLRRVYDEGLVEEFAPAPATSDEPGDGVPLIISDQEPPPRFVERFGEG